jgi:hypothetical protein
VVFIQDLRAHTFYVSLADMAPYPPCDDDERRADIKDE